MNWDFKREESKGFEPIPEGKYRIRVKSAERAVSKAGKDMITLQFEVSGQSRIVYYYIVFLPETPQVTNGKLTQFYDSFKDIPEGSTDLASWVGKVGACMIKHREYNGNKKEEISYFIKADKQDDLPPWVDKSQEFIKVDAGAVPDVPFI